MLTTRDDPISPGSNSLVTGVTQVTGVIMLSSKDDPICPMCGGNKKEGKSQKEARDKNNGITSLILTVESLTAISLYFGPKFSSNFRCEPIQYHYLATLIHFLYLKLCTFHSILFQAKTAVRGAQIHL